MKQILCFGDSNTWGYDGESGKRLPWGVRWTSLLQGKFSGEEVRIIEEGLCGRTTIFEDPLRDGRRGTALLPTLLESHSPADIVILMLGTNDCKTSFGASAEVIGKGVVRLLEQIEEYAPAAQTVLISPIYLGEKVWKEGYDREFSRQSVDVSRELGKIYKKIAEERNIHFLNAAEYVQCCETDQEHMNAAGHGVLAEAIYQLIRGLV